MILETIQLSEKLKEARITHEIYNKGYHLQIQLIHNFYPSTGTYYNSDTTHKSRYPEFKDGHEVLQWISGETPLNESNMIFTPEYICGILQDFDTIVEAINYFNGLIK